MINKIFVFISIDYEPGVASSNLSRRAGGGSLGIAPKEMRDRLPGCVSEVRESGRKDWKNIFHNQIHASKKENATRPKRFKL